MPQEPLRAVLDYLKRVSTSQEMRNWADAQLLARFVAQRDEAAFSALVSRHGPMVQGVCRRVLGDVHHAEDAFQATFMVLVRRAASVRKHAPLGGWLYRVAQRVALKARAKVAARQRRHQELTDMPRAEPLDDLTWQDLRPVLDEEIGRLPEKYRAPVVLCYFEGKTHEQAAKELGWPRKSLTNRLARARELLRRQLTSRGIALSAGALATALTEKAAPTALAAMLSIKTAKAAACLAAGKTVAETVLSAQAFAMAEEAVKTMFAINMKLVVVVMAVGLVVGGTGVAGYHGWGGLAAGHRVSSSPQTVQKPPPKINLAAPQAKHAAPAVDLNDDPLPLGAVTRLGKDRWLHSAIATLVEFLPDGHVVTVNDDATIRLWDFPSGKQIRRTPLPALANIANGFVRGALTKDGKTIATYVVGGTEIYFHDIATGKELRQRIRLPQSDVPQKGQAPNRQLIGLDALTFSPNGKQVATLTRRDTVTIWDWAEGKEIGSFSAPANATFHLRSYLYQILYSPNGELIATGVVDEDNTSKDKNVGVVNIWDPITATKKFTFRTAAAYGPGAPVFLAFSPDSKTLAYATDQTIRLENMTTGKEIGTLTTKDARFWVMVFSKDGTKLYAGSKLYVNHRLSDSTVMEWDLATRSLRRESPVSANASYQISLSPDGHTLVLGGRGPFFSDLQGDKNMTALSNPTSLPMLALQFLPDSKSLLTASGLGARFEYEQIQKWDTVTGKNLASSSTAYSLLVAPAVSPDGKLLACCPQKTNVVIIDRATGKELCNITPISQGRHFEYRTLGFLPDSKTFVVSTPEQQVIEFYEVSSGKLLRRITAVLAGTPGNGNRGGVKGRHTIVFSADGKLLACYGNPWPSTVAVFDTLTGKQIASLALPQDPKGGVGSPVSEWAAFSPDGRCLALETNDGTVAFYELASAKLRRTLGKKQPPRQDTAKRPSDFDSRLGTRFAFSPDGKTFVHVDLDGILHLYDIVTGEVLATFKGHAERVNAVAFAPDGKTVASASDDSTALIWDVSKITRPAAPAKALQAGDLERCWLALVGNDAEKAFDAIRSLWAAPKEAVAWIKLRVKPAVSLDRKRVEDLIVKLDDNQYKVRQTASSELLNLGKQIVPALDKALAANPPLETKRRLENLRGTLSDLTLQGEQLRAYRAVEVLELIATPKARQVLQALAEGGPGAVVTVSAQGALKRLANRP